MPVPPDNFSKLTVPSVRGRHDADEAVTARMAALVERCYVFTGNDVFVFKTNIGQHIVEPRDLR